MIGDDHQRLRAAFRQYRRRRCAMGLFSARAGRALIFYTGNLLWVESRRKREREAGTVEQTRAFSATVAGAKPLALDASLPALLPNAAASTLQTDRLTRRASSTVLAATGLSAYGGMGHHFRIRQGIRALLASRHTCAFRNDGNARIHSPAPATIGDSFHSTRNFGAWANDRLPCRHMPVALQ
ncbi:MAG: hypothetical protein K2Y17_06930 [Qipengyuania sp.]|nr:hypothetical protein [Qipengyuania sp.]